MIDPYLTFVSRKLTRDTLLDWERRLRSTRDDAAHRVADELWRAIVEADYEATKVDTIPAPTETE